MWFRKKCAVAVLMAAGMVLIGGCGGEAAKKPAAAVGPTQPAATNRPASVELLGTNLVCRIAAGEKRGELNVQIQNDSVVPLYLFTHQTANLFWWHCQARVDDQPVQRRDAEMNILIPPASAADFIKLEPQQVFSIGLPIAYWSLPAKGRLVIRYTNEKNLVKDCDGQAFGKPAWLGKLDSNGIELEELVRKWNPPA
jgi:hypothetical protein